MKLGRNLLAGFANSAWTAVVGLVAAPFYVRVLGMEAYGLIGFFMATQALFLLLDMGMAPTINREVARSLGQLDRAPVRNLLHSLSMVFWILSATIGLLALTSAPWISRYWLTSHQLPPQVIYQAVVMMGVIIALRLPVGLYVGVLMGAQKMVLASGVEMAFITVANLGAMAVLTWVSPTLQAFFAWQVCAGLINVALVHQLAWRTLTDPGASHRPRFDLARLREIWRFSAGVGVAGLLGVLFLQGDKLVLSRLVPLDALARYTLAALVARSLYMFVTPIFGAVYPRMSAMQAAGQVDEIATLYGSGARLMMAVIAPLAALIAVFSRDIFMLWTGDAALAFSVGPIVDLLLIGTVLHGAMHFPFALQLAHGQSRLPMLINLGLMIVFAPLLIILALRYGVVGGAAAWAILNGLYLVVGTWATHRTLLPGRGLKWVLGDVLAPLVAGVMVAGGGALWLQTLAVPLLIQCLGAGLFALLAFALILAFSPGIVRELRRMFPPAQIRSAP